MAASSNILFVVFTCGLVCATAGIFDHVFDSVNSCHDTCDNTYSAHTYENGDEASSCNRGCRLYSMIAFIHDHAENETMAGCIGSCLEAYNSTSRNSSSEADACVTGCQGQHQAQKTMKTDDDDDDAEARKIHMLYPLMYMHSVYSHMLDRMYNHLEYSWSVFRQGDTGQIVVVRSQPVVIEFAPVDMELEDTPWPDERTSSLVETNIAGQDNSATPFFSFAFGPSQLRSSQGLASPKGLQLDSEDSGQSDWLSCVARKTGIARIILCFLILATAVVMMWFCLTAAAAAPEQARALKHLSIQSIHDDLGYLRSLDEKDCLKMFEPQTRVEVAPLPIKIKVEQI
ncbi:hypothetical protein ACOMHN_025991 [Nucella lapillus]